MKLKKYAQLAELRALCIRAHWHGRIVGASDGGGLDEAPEWVKRPSLGWRAQREIGQAWMNGFLEGGEEWMEANPPR